MELWPLRKEGAGRKQRLALICEDRLSCMFLLDFGDVKRQDRTALSSTNKLITGRRSSTLWSRSLLQRKTATSWTIALVKVAEQREEGKAGTKEVFEEAGALKRTKPGMSTESVQWKTRQYERKENIGRWFE